MGIEELVLDRAKKEGYTAGLLEGKTDAKYMFVKNLFKKTDLTDMLIAEIVEVPTVFVENLRKMLGK